MHPFRDEEGCTLMLSCMAIRARGDGKCPLLLCTYAAFKIPWWKIRVYYEVLLLDCPYSVRFFACCLFRRRDVPLVLRCDIISFLFLLFVNRVFARNLIGLGFLQSVSYNKINPNNTKNYLLWEKKVAQMPLFNLIFLGLG